MPSREPRFDFQLERDVEDDLRRLPSDRLRKIAIFRIQNLVHGDERGPALTGIADPDLSGCRRLYFDEVPERARWRIVYRELDPPAPGKRPIIHLLAVGARYGMDAYTRAALRLGLLNPEDAD